MHIKSIQIENVLSHQNSTFNLGPLTVFRGDNGSGKSTIIYALQALATGIADCSDARGSGLKALIRSGEDRGAVTAEIADDGELRKVRCSITEKSGRTMTCGKELDASYTGADYLAMLAMKKDIMAILINSKNFFGNGDAKSEAAQKDLLASILLPDTIEFEEWVWPAVDTCGIRVNRSQKPFHLIQACYDAAYEERKAINRGLKEWRQPETPGENAMPLEAVRARLKERQDQRTALAVRRNGIIGKYENQASARKKSLERIEGLELKLATEQGRRTDAAKGMLSKGKLAEAQNIAKCADTAKGMDADLERIAAEIRATEKTMSALNSLRESKKCPTCTQEVTEEEFNKIASPVVDQQNKLLDEQIRTMEGRKVLSDYEGARKDLERHHQAKKDVSLIDSHIVDIEKDIADLKKEAQPEQTKTHPDTSAIDAEIADLDERIEKGSAALQEAIQADSVRRHYATAMEAKKQLDAKQQMLEKLVDYFGPKGVQATVLDKSVAPFEASMNAIMAGWRSTASNMSRKRPQTCGRIASFSTVPAIPATTPLSADTAK